MLNTALTRAVAVGVKPVVQITSVETIVTTARTTINVVQAKNVVTTNAPIHVFRMLDPLQALSLVQ